MGRENTLQRAECENPTDVPNRAASPAASSLVAFICLVAGLAALAVPVALVRVPPLLDYPNHFARIWLLSGGIDKPPLSAMYVVDWAAAWTNIGIDLIAATVGRGVGADALGPLLIATALALPPLGAALLNRAVFGGWHWWQAGFAVFAWSGTLVMGFLSFQIGLGLALMAAAGDAAIERRVGPVGTFIARAVLCGGLLVFHVFAAAFYAALLAGLAFGRERAPVAPAVWRSVRVAVPALALPLGIFLLLVPSIPGGHAPEGVYDGRPAYALANKLGTVFTAIATYDLSADCVFAVAVVVTVWLVASRRGGQAHWGLLVAACGLLALAVATPSPLGGTLFVDWRFPIMALFAAAAALRPEARTTAAATVGASVLLLVGLARTGWIGDIWVQRRADATAMERALALVPAGSAVLPLVNRSPGDIATPPGRHFAVGRIPLHLQYPALAVPWREAFVPMLFAARGKQPLRVMPPWDAMAVLEGHAAPADLLDGFVPTPQCRYVVGYLAEWRERFDYILLLNADSAHFKGVVPSLQRMEPISDQGFARLYRVPRGEAGDPGGRAPESAGSGEAKRLC